MDFELDFENAKGFYVNCDEVSKDKSLLAVTRVLAQNLMRDSYMPVGQFFDEMCDADLQTLLVGSELDDDEHVMLDDILLLSMMLAQAEGAVTIDNVEDARTAMGQFIGFIALESLARKGLIKLYRENMSFGDDLGDKVIAERID